MIKRSAKEYLLLSITSFICLATLIFASIRFYQHDWATSVFDLVIATAMCYLFVYVYKTRDVDRTSMMLALAATISVSGAIYINGSVQYYWVYPAAIAYYYLFSPRTAVIINAVLMLSIYWVTYGAVDAVELSSMLVTLIISNIFAFFFAVTTKAHQQDLIENQDLSLLVNKTLALIVSSQSLPEVLDAIVSSIEAEYKDVMCSILLLDNTGKRLHLGAAPSLPDFYNQAIDGVAIGEGVGSCGTAAFTGKRVIVEDISSHAYWTPWQVLAAKAELGSCWSQPIITASGQVLGTFALYHKDKRSPGAMDIKLIEQFASLASIAIEKNKISQQIWQQANFDDLTALPNRNRMRVLLNQAIKNAHAGNRQLAVLFLDLDNFKDVNDTLGHASGDMLLQKSARRIAKCIGANDTVARLGGDEFVVIMSDLVERDRAEQLAQRLLNKLSRPFRLNDEVVQTSVSIGITHYPEDGLTLDNLLKNADQAMYGAKARGRNNYHYFSQSMREDALNRRQLIQDLRNAIKNNEFFLVFQPIVNLATGDIYKAEALIRWQHPSRGLVGPVDFIELAEESGLIIEISNWVFQQALAMVTRWRQRYHADFQISINTSPVQYKEGTGNIKQWLAQLQGYGAIAKGLAFEITESLLMENKSGVGDVLLAVQKAGIPLAIDDFGTGYSSLSYLKKYQTDYLKIDKSFVQNMSQDSNDMALCEAIVLMAKKLNIKVIAEGIETLEQKQLLGSIDCDYGQGYLFAKPVPTKEFEALLSRQLQLDLALA